jgi:hypothetical protein
MCDLSNVTGMFLGNTSASVLRMQKKLSKIGTFSLSFPQYEADIDLTCSKSADMTVMNLCSCSVFAKCLITVFTGSLHAKMFEPN